MKNKIIAILLSVTLLGSAVGATAWAVSDNRTSVETEKISTTTDSVFTADAATATDGVETVYVLTAADGSTKKIIVSDQYVGLSADEAETAAKSNLTDPQNVKGEDCWQGTSDKALPVTIKTTYTLDGMTVTPEELAGKSGHVTIHYDYTNTRYEMMRVRGKDTKIHVPFAAVTGLLLDSDRFFHVEVTNGKTISDGDRTVVMGVALPGLQENLNLDRGTIDLPEYFEISADVQDFQLETTLTIVSNSVFNDLEKDASGQWNLDDLSADMDTLTDAMEQLMDGSGDLYDGLCTLYNSVNTLSDGIDTLTSGLKKLSSNSATLDAGAKQVFEALLSTADTQLAASGLTLPNLTIDNYTSVLSGVLQQLDHDGVIAAAQTQVEQAVRASQTDIEQAVTAAIQQQVTAQITQTVRENVLAQVLSAQSITAEQYAALDDTTRSTIDSIVSAQMSTPDIEEAISSQTSLYMAGADAQALIVSQSEQQIQAIITEQMGSDTVLAKISAADAGALKVQALKQQLDSYNTFYQGLLTYITGVNSAYTGAEKIDSNMSALVSGVRKLRNGAGELADGVKQLNDEGISQLADLLDGDIGSLSDRLQATVDVSKRYHSYTSDGVATAGTVKYIFRSDAIESIS